jgi:hypothetical protein
MIGNKRELDEGIKVMTKMHKAGIKVLPFGDYGFAWLPQGTEARDLEHFVSRSKDALRKIGRSPPNKFQGGADRTASRRTAAKDSARTLSCRDRLGMRP